MEFFFPVYWPPTVGFLPVFVVPVCDWDSTHCPGTGWIEGVWFLVSLLSENSVTHGTHMLPFTTTQSKTQVYPRSISIITFHRKCLNWSLKSTLEDHWTLQREHPSDIYNTFFFTSAVVTKCFYRKMKHQTATWAWVIEYSDTEIDFKTRSLTRDLCFFQILV